MTSYVMMACYDCEYIWFGYCEEGPPIGLECPNCGGEDTIIGGEYAMSAVTLRGGFLNLFYTKDLIGTANRIRIKDESEEDSE